MTIQGKVKRSFYNTFDHPFRLEKLEPVVCDFCGSGSYRPITVELGFEVRECRECGMVYVSPQPAQEELSAFYEAMSSGATTLEEAQARTLGLYEGYLRALIERRMPGGGTLVDAGCGLGLFLKRMEESDWELHGIELSKSAAAFAQSSVPRAKIHYGKFEDAPLAAASLECVVAVGVLEHVKSPRKTIEQFTRWLVPGGLLALQVPYVTPFIRVRRWVPFVPLYFEAPHHLFDFSPRCIKRYLSEAGYEDIRFDIQPPYASPNRLITAALWSVKLGGRLAKAASGGRYIYPFVGSYVVNALKKA